MNIIGYSRPACSESESCLSHGCRAICHETRNQLEVKLPQAEGHCRDVAGPGMQRSYREPHQLAFRHTNLANCERRSFVKGHRHAGDHRSVGMRVVLRKDRVVSPQPELSRIGRDETRLTSMRQVRKALPRCTCSKTLVENASAQQGRPKHHGIDFHSAQILLHDMPDPETHENLTLVRGMRLCDAHPICNNSGLLVTGRRSSVRLCRGIDRRVALGTRLTYASKE